MRRQDSMLDLRRQKSVENLLNKVRSSQDADFQPPVEPDLIIKDVTVEDFKQSVRDAAGFQQQSCGDVIDVTLIAECFHNRFLSLKYRQRPMTITRHTEGFVGGRIFWQDSQKYRLSLYDRSRPEPEDRPLTAAYFPAKPHYAQRFTHTPSVGAAPMSIMAQFLYDQLDEIAKSNIGHISNNVVESENNTSLLDELNDNDSVWVSEKELHTSDTLMDSTREVSKKKSVFSRIMKDLRKLLCCAGQNGDE